MGEVAENAINSFGDVKDGAFPPILASRRAREFLRRSRGTSVRAGGPGWLLFLVSFG